jgi:hypothetical protein
MAIVVLKSLYAGRSYAALTYSSQNREQELIEITSILSTNDMCPM